MDTRQNLIRELIPNEAGSTFVYKQERSIWPAWHYHEEIDILLFQQCGGQHITGDCIGTFQPGTLIVNGSNVPHCFTSTRELALGPSETAITVLQFSEKSIGREFLSKPEMQSINDFIKSTDRSFEYSGGSRTKAASIILGMRDSRGMERFGEFLRLLEVFADAPSCDKRPLVSEYYAPVLNEDNINRIEQVRLWVQANLNQKISLERAASQIQMPPKAFSYFFKKNTGKAFVQYVKELRIGLASQKLLETDLTVVEICYECGYNNLSNFNRQFREVKNTTPTSYRKQFKYLTDTEHRTPEKN